MRNLTLAIAFGFATAAMFAPAPAKAEEMLKSIGKCWVNDHKANYGWGDCPREPARAAKASKASAEPQKHPTAAVGARAPASASRTRA